MAIWQSSSRRRRSGDKRRRNFTSSGLTAGLSHRVLRLEPFEERMLLSVNGPVLLTVIPAQGQEFDGTNDVLHFATNQMTFRFDSAVNPSSLTLNNAPIQFIRGVNHQIGDGDDQAVQIGSIAQGDTPNDVIVRFDQNLPDDLYQIRIKGTGSNPIKDANGKAYNNGVDTTQQFTLDLGPQVVAVVPQPVSRDTASGKINWDRMNQIDVYFNQNDPLDATAAKTPQFYQLIRTNATATPGDDTVILPLAVNYNETLGKVTLTFNTADITTAGTYRLRIGTAEPLSLAPVIGSLNHEPGSSFATAAQVSNPTLTGTAAFSSIPGTQTVELSGAIFGTPVQVLYPGDPSEPGERDPAIEAHVMAGANTSGVIPTIYYNFKSQYGSVLGQPVFNNITPEQKQRVREVFSYFANYLGVQFVETASQGMTIATGDVRAIDPNAPPAGIGGMAGGGLAIMNSMVNWGSNEAGGSYFQTAMHEIGHNLGLGHDYEAPGLTIMGGSENIAGSISGEPVFPGDLDIVYAQYLLPPVGNEIDTYRFDLPAAGQLNLESFAERLRQIDPSKDPSQLDTALSLYKLLPDGSKQLVSRNDDYYGKDSFIQMTLDAGTYFVVVTSTGNTNFDPTIADTGFGGTTQGQYELRLTFTPTVSQGITDKTGTLLDGDNDGNPGGAYNFWFNVDTAHTIFVDKAAPASTGTLGSINNPYHNISDALAVATPGSIVRIVGNGSGVNGVETGTANLKTALSYNIGFDSVNQPLSDGSTFEIPRGVTVMVDAGTIIKLRGANIDVGSSAQGISRAGGALQVLGTTAKKDGVDVGSVYFTSYYNSNIGTDPGTNKGSLVKGNWGGLVFRDDSDNELQGIFLNYVNHANLSYGGGQVTVNSVASAYAPLFMVTARPTLTYNTIVNSASVAMSADPNSFEESEFLGDVTGSLYHADYSRVGPKIYGSTLANNSINGLFIRIRTNNGSPVDTLTVHARIANTDIVHVLNEVLLIDGQPGGFTQDAGGRPVARPSASLVIDPGIVLKMSGARIETEIGANFIAEGTVDHPIIFTSQFDDRFGAGGVSDTTNDGSATTPAKGNWGGLFFGPLSDGSIDHALIAYAGGTTTFEGGFDNFDPVEIHQAQVRITNSTFDQDQGKGGGLRAGRQSSDASIIFIRGAQPVILNNVIKNSSAAAMSVNINALNSIRVTDTGRSRGSIDMIGNYVDNTGPLIRNNRIGNNDINGMLVRGGTITTNVVLDDTDIVHVVQDSIFAPNQQSLSGTLRLQSSATESLVVKLLGTNTDIVATGKTLDTTDRLGGSVQIVGTPNHPVVLTSLKDDTVGAGLTPEGLPQTDTRNTKGVVPPAPQPLATQGPVILHSAPLDEHGYFANNTNWEGWANLQQLVNYVFTNSRATVPDANANVILAIGLHDLQTLGPTYSQTAIEDVANRLGLTVFWRSSDSEIAGVDFSQYKMVYIPSDSKTPLPDLRPTNLQDIALFGGITDGQLADLTARKDDLQKYVNQQGGGLLALSQNNAEKPYSWFADPDPIIIEKTGGNVLATTSQTPPGLPNSQAGLPWLYNFKGSTGFNRLQPFLVDPVTGEIGMLGLAAGGVGVGPPQDIARAGDWGSITLDLLSNDRNVDVVNETEQGFTAGVDPNGTPGRAQFLGELAKDQVSGDDNVRLGYEVHGDISQASNQASGIAGDVDVYSFNATPGTRVWFDIDRTSSSLDTVIELVDANGVPIASSDNSIDTTTLSGLAQPLSTGSLNGVSNPFSNADFYSTNPKDAGMRVDLPSKLNPDEPYFIRVRARSGDASSQNLTGGLTKGAYVLQIRIQEVDEFPGSTVRNADIRYAINGVEVVGKPEHSPLVSGSSEVAGGNNTILTAQFVGNVLAADHASTSVSGNLTSSTQVDWYKFQLNYTQIQSIAGLSDGTQTFAAMLRINNADGLVRPDTTLSLFDSTGTLLMVARDSQIVDALPRPGQGSDSTNLGHGSFGALDPTLGPIQIPAGGVVTTGDDGTPQGVVTYYVAVSSGASLPTQLLATLNPNSLNPLVRLEPNDGIKRVAEDHIGFPTQPISTADAPQALFPANSVQQLNAYADPYSLGDVVLFVNTVANNNTNNRLRTVDPFTGATFNTASNAPQLPGSAAGYYDIAMRNDGRLFSLTQGTNNDNSGNLNQLDTATGAVVSSSDDALTTSSIDTITPPVPPIPAQITWNDSNRGIQFEAMAYLQSDANTTRRLFAIGHRAANDPAGTPPATANRTNLLFELDPNTGAVLYQFQGTYSPFVLGGTRGNGSGTNAIPVGTLTAGVTGNITGMTFAKVNNVDTMVVVTDSGNLYSINGWQTTVVPTSPTDFLGGDFDNATASSLQPLPLPLGRQIVGLTTGPQHVENGAYAATLFAIDSGGTLYAMNTDGTPAGVFLNGRSTINTGITGAQGLAFSTLDYNLWHGTITRGTDPGHGIAESPDNNLLRSILPAQDLGGGASFYFGLEPVPPSNSPAVAQPGVIPYGTNPDLYSTYSLPGGAYGSLTTTTFDLAGYNAFDLPTLYFNYYLDTPDINSLTNTALDSVRVMISPDGANWQPLATNNVVLGSSGAENPFALSPQGGIYRDTDPSRAGVASKQKVQALFDPATDGSQSWRQARVDLGDYAGLSNLRLRFVFSTAGSMGSGNGNSGTGIVLSAKPGNQLANNSTFTVDNTVFRFVTGAGGAATDIPITANMSANDVATAIAAALDRVFTVGTDDTSISTSSKVSNGTVRIFGHTVNSAGPLAVSVGQLPGDSYGNFSSTDRDASDRKFEGVYIDDLIVGFAGRGEMVTNATPSDPTFSTLPTIPGAPARVLTGPYQLQIGGTDSYAESVSGTNVGNNNPGAIQLLQTYDVNDRFAEGITVVAPAGSQIGNGQMFRIDDGHMVQVFRFRTSGSSTDGAIDITYNTSMTATQIATLIRDAINNTASFRVKASMATRPAGSLPGANQPTGNRVDLFDAVQVDGGPLTVLIFGVPGGVTQSGQGDTNNFNDSQRMTQAPGQTIIEGTRISHSRQVGIKVTPRIGQVSDPGIADTLNGSFPINMPGAEGTAANLSVPNNNAWIPGVTINNNLVVDSGRTAIEIGGNPNAPGTYSLQQPPERYGVPADVPRVVPFARVFNNTIYQAVLGVAAANKSSPTIINNIVSNTAIGIIADGPSNVSGTVVGTNIYQNNGTNVNNVVDSNSDALAPNEPLFVDPSKGNFYLLEGSRAIDSSVNSLQERFAMAAATSPLGFPPSPIQAPDYDLLGQLRVDDESVPSPPGLGSNVFKDRGAIERADIDGPVAQLANPIDNDAGGLDKNPASNRVRIVVPPGTPSLTNFSIKLVDDGVGVDDSTVNVSQFVITRVVNGVGVTLIPNVDYVLAYDTNSKIARLIPKESQWTNATYTITINNTATGIKDLANNQLQANEAPNTTFVVELTDHVTSPWQNPTFKQDVNGDGIVSGRDLLIVINRILQGMLGPIPSNTPAPPYIDVSGDGNLSPLDLNQIVSYILTHPTSPQSATSLSAAPQSATPLAAGDGPEAAPQAIQDTTPVEVGLAMTQSASAAPQAYAAASPRTADDQDTSTPAGGSTALMESTRQKAVATTIADEDIDPYDTELDSILSDLSGDLHRLV